MQNIVLRQLERSEVVTVWQIERREVVHEVYRLAEDVLQLHPEFYDTQDWPEGEPELYTPICSTAMIMAACFGVPMLQRNWLAL